jgi:Ni,Fe-hydrogenase I cytochrome b subunit
VVDELVYRGDSFICAAAVHAGVLQDARGGCGVVSLVGEKSSFGSVSRNGISSVGFNSSFPLSFTFNRDQTVNSSAAKCKDPRWDLLILSTVFTAFISLITSTPLAFFVPIFTIVYFQIAMASDPPNYTDYPSLASTAIGNFLPAAFIGALIYQFCVRKTLSRLQAQFEKTVLWVGGCWVGALSNITLEKIPLQRLTPHDLNQQPGALTALIIIVLIIAGVALYQAWCFRNEGRLPRYLALYATLGIGLLILLAIPGLSLRIHHYILALLLLPGTSLQTRPSLLFQGLLVGLFINGIARWGFAPILQTEAALRGDARLGYGIPEILAPVINSTTITFTWNGLLRGYEGVSVLVNDVERFRGFHKDGDASFTWLRHDPDHPEYFRFGFVNYLLFGTITYSDFTRAGTWWPNGTWTDIPPGLS